MRARQDALKVGAAALALVFAEGCGAIFNTNQQVTFATDPKDKAVVYQNGVPLSTSNGQYSAHIVLGAANTFVAAAPGKKISRVTPERHVNGVAIALDVLWSLTIIGIAAPITDALLGGFQTVDDHIPVTLAPDPEVDNPMPVYEIAGERFDAGATPRPANQSSETHDRAR